MQRKNLKPENPQEIRKGFRGSEKVTSGSYGNSSAFYTNHRNLKAYYPMFSFMSILNLVTCYVSAGNLAFHIN